VLVTVIHFRPSLIVADKAGTYHSELLSLAHKYCTRVEVTNTLAYCGTEWNNKLKKCKLFEYQHLLLLRDIWWSNFKSLNVVHFSTLMLIRHLWQLKAFVFLQWRLMRTALLITTLASFIVQIPEFVFFASLKVFCH
jgi:hypothetical protein